MIIHTPLSITLVAIATTVSMIFISLGHMPRPSRATALWTAAFVDLMIASYIWIASDVLESMPLRGIGNGLILGSMALMWAGLRAFRGVRSRFAVALSVLIAMPLVLFLVSTTDIYAMVFRGAYVVTAVFAALTIVELIRLGRAVRDEVSPLLIVAALFIVFAAVTVVDGVLVATGRTSPADSLLFVRGINFIGANVFAVCALVALMQLTTRDATVRTRATGDVFGSVVRGRLARAEAAADPSWSFVDIRLDDPTDIRVASSTAMFKEIIDRFSGEVYAALPADADIRRMSPAQIVALVPRAQGGMREILSDVLRRVAAIETAESFPIRLSASAGWAHAATGEYDLDRLLTLTGEAVLRARDTGGDRWERVQGDR